MRVCELIDELLELYDEYGDLVVVDGNYEHIIGAQEDDDVIRII